MVKGVSDKKAVQTTPPDGQVEADDKVAADGKSSVKETKGAKEVAKEPVEPLVDQVTSFEKSDTPVEAPVNTSVQGGTRALEMAIKSGKYDGPEGLAKLKAEIEADGGGDLLQQMMGKAGGPLMADGDGDGRIDDEPDPEVRAFLQRNFGDFERSRDLATAGQDSLARALEIARKRRGDGGSIQHTKRRKAKEQQKKDRTFFEREFNNRYIHDKLADAEVEDRGFEDDMIASAEMDDAEFEKMEADRLAAEEAAERDEMEREIARRSRSRYT